MIYIINKRTKEHQLRHEGLSQQEVLDGWVPVRYEPGGWITWDGGDCPTPPGMKVQWKSECGFVSKPVEGTAVSWGGTRRIIAYRPMLDTQPEAPEWDGEGLPPAGCECEVSWGHLGNEYHRCTILAFDSMGHPIVEMDDLYIKQAPKACRFRPLRTPAQRAEDEAVRRIMRITAEAQPIGEDVAERHAVALYRAGYRKS